MRNICDCITNEGLVAEVVSELTRSHTNHPRHMCLISIIAKTMIISAIAQMEMDKPAVVREVLDTVQDFVLEYGEEIVTAANKEIKERANANFTLS